MADETPLSLFQHDPLPDSTTHIRLLEILHGKLEQHVVCELSAWPIDTAPPYYAISYTWGDPASTANITVNGKSMVVRQNCEYVLQQAFASKASKYYWIDAICIDQTATQEKNHQVAMMGQVYRRATHVFACVGPHLDDSEFLLEMIGKICSLLTAIHSKLYDPYGWQPENPIYVDTWLASRCVRTMNATARQRLVKAFLAFMQRPYFKRVWILQELYLASKVFYCCGTDIESPDHLVALSMLIDFWLCDHTIGHVLSRSATKFKKSNMYWKMWSTFYDIAPQRGCLGLASGIQKSQHLETVLRNIHQFQCADARDKLYGVLSLVNWEGRSQPVPDYDKDNSEVAFEILGTLLERGSAYSFSEVYWARYLCQVFDVSPANKAVRKAIEARSSPTADALVSDHTNSEQVSLTGGCWYGTQILPFYATNETVQSPQGQSKRRRNLRCSGRKRDQSFIEVLDEQGRLFAFAPPGTRGGDWYLRQMFGDPNVGLIVRGSQSDRYTLVGPTLRLVSETHIREAFKPSEIRFKVWWHLEDLLVLGWRLAQLPLDKPPHDKIVEYVNTRICISEDSSFAEKIDL